jgi:RHS repeat-associated protein
VQSTGTSTVPYHFVGRSGYYHDQELADYYVRARHYSPALARWLSEDPLKHADGATRTSLTSIWYKPRLAHTSLRWTERDQRALLLSLNSYLYIGCNPVNLVDPTGEVPEEQVECAERTSWTPKMCDEECPCPCSYTRWPSFIPSQEELQTIVRNLTRDIRCPVKIARGNCKPGYPGLGWTCPGFGGANARTIYICISDQYDRCGLQEVLVHEIEHAKDFCRFPVPYYEDPRAGEQNAYNKSCEEAANQRCLKGKDKLDYVELCKNTLIQSSLDPRVGGPCDQLHDIFPDPRVREHPHYRPPVRHRNKITWSTSHAAYIIENV